MQSNVKFHGADLLCSDELILQESIRQLRVDFRPPRAARPPIQPARYGADVRHAPEQLCRFITRPALANKRVQSNGAGQVVLKLKIPWRDGVTQLKMSPLEFMQRLAALVPRLRLHRTG